MRASKEEIDEALACLARDGRPCPTTKTLGDMCECGELLAPVVVEMRDNIKNTLEWTEHYKQSMLNQRTRAEKAEAELAKLNKEIDEAEGKMYLVTTRRVVQHWKHRAEKAERLYADQVKATDNLKAELAEAKAVLQEIEEIAKGRFGIGTKAGRPAAQP